MANIISRFAYPCTFALAVVLFGVLHAMEVTLTIALYVPLLLTAVIVLGLQRIAPERGDWQAQWRNVKTDLWFIALVQITLPGVFTALVVLGLSSWAHTHWASELWPHAWPLAAQVIVMVFLIDFMRYWLHRACHHNRYLWRLHQVHHAPRLLYSLNSARFHPLEKVLHFALDSVPFLLLGVAPEAMAGYFLVYAVNGLFQHGNIRLRYGWLNYVVASADLHRWHHAMDAHIKPCNFSNTTIVWDLLFGTYYLPSDRRVNQVGVREQDGEPGFLQSLSAPFIGRRGAGIVSVLRHHMVNAILHCGLWVVAGLQLWRTRAIAKDPMAHQRHLLKQIIETNQNTVFGRAHGFSDIRSYEDYARAVTVNDFEALRPSIETEINTGVAALTQDAPVRYARTSGTTGDAKDVPLTRGYLAQLKGIHRTATAFQHRLRPDAFSGGILAIGGVADELLLNNGKPTGAASGIVAASTMGLLREKFVVPPEVFGVVDSRLKYLLMLRLALACPDITLIVTANASTLLVLLDLYREYQSLLIKDVRAGGFFLSASLPEQLVHALLTRLRPMSERAAALDALRRRVNTNVTLMDLWPNVRAIATWTCASAGIAVAALRRQLSPAVSVFELGYVASEFRATVTLGRHAGTGMPTLTTHFFEFVEKARWDAGERQCLTLDQIKKGVDYYVIVTNPSGLYRYFINDLVRVRGFFRKTPLLQFVQKGKGVTNITGEKLYEGQMLSAVNGVLDMFNIVPRFLMMLADETTRRYTLYVETDQPVDRCNETMIDAIEARLAAQNLEYQCKRDSGRLQRLSLRWLSAGTGEVYKQSRVANGQREAQFKTIALAYARDFPFDLEANTQENRIEDRIHSSVHIDDPVREIV